MSPIAPIWTRSSSCSPRYEYRRASERTSDMCSSISCSLAARSPRSWYRRNSSLSRLSPLIGPLGDPLDLLAQVDPAAVGALEHAHPVRDRLEHPAQPD